MSTVSSQLLLSYSHQGQSDEEEVTVMQFCISLQSGLLSWAHQLALASTDHRYMYVKPGSQYDAGAVNVMNIVSVTEKSIFFTSQIACLILNFSTI